MIAIKRFGSSRSHEVVALVAERIQNKPGEGRLVVDPPFQRGSVWSLTQKQAWIESMLNDLPLPAIFINRFPFGHPTWGFDDILIDGRQRIEAIYEFMQDKFSVRGELWSAQGEPFKRGFRMTIACPVIYSSFEKESECAEIYVQLLTAGTAHTAEEIEKARKLVAQLRAEETGK